MATNTKRTPPTVTWCDGLDDQADPEITAWVQAKVQELLDDRDLGSIEHTDWLIRVAWWRQPQHGLPGEIWIENV